MISYLNSAAEMFQIPSYLRSKQRYNRVIFKVAQNSLLTGICEVC